MTIDDRRLRERTAQRRLITSTARALAEKESWDVVTTRRLSAEIEYSQPVIYKHFASLEDLAEAVALEGFDELTDALTHARRDASPEDAVGAVARAYTSYAIENPALYDVMFTRVTRLSFGGDDAPPPLPAAYGELRAAVAMIAVERDIDILTEVLWAALHGLIMLGRNGRIRPDKFNERISRLIDQFSAR
ncbi:TetR/AcrR family transcriptional regulator [Glaciihabitans sp. UYNi722]|uniref:TetR/AcrR family transcriptional regulator n=1 Tax=Glaciihabitans sp. UYNi722 TaxID=3156344 RepID=UPI0033997C72